MDIKTIEDIRALRPCYDPSRYLSENWQGMALDILRVHDCPAEDRLWVVLHDGWITENQACEFACCCAERALPIFEAKYPNDDRPREAIQISRAYMCGDVTRDRLLSVWSTAWNAAWSVRGAARSAARAAAGAAAGTSERTAPWFTVWSAAWAAAEAAAKDAARDAARDAAWDTSWAAWDAAWAAWNCAVIAQAEIMIDILEGKHGRR